MSETKIITADEREEMAHHMRERILSVLPAATYQMGRFLQMVDVVVSDRSPTACVEVGHQPRLHVNADFVEERCRKDEHLLMLVFHELYHILLGHTRLFPRLTEAHNIAFDALINAQLCHMFPDPVFVEFFRNLNPSGEIPGVLLRPPEDWPGTKPAHSKSDGPREKILCLLYGDRLETATYGEVLNLLQQATGGCGGCGKGALPDGSPSAGSPAPKRRGKKAGNSGKSPFVLLGDHDGSESSDVGDSKAIEDELLRDILTRTVADWPEAANLGKQRGSGGGILDLLMPRPRSPRKEFLLALRRLLHRVRVLPTHVRPAYAWRMERSAIQTTSALPNWRDRHAHSHEVLFGQAPVLYQTSAQRMRPRWSPRETPHVYLDISGSMSRELPFLVAALDPLRRSGACRLFVFSTVVDEVKPGWERKDRVQNTFGTDINCVYRHVLQYSPPRTPRRVVVLTDGHTGVPNRELHQGWANRKVSLYVGVTEGDTQTLRPFARRIEQLPQLL